MEEPITPWTEMSEVLLNREMDWETTAVDRGIHRYRKELAGSDLSDTSVGRRISRDVLPRFIDAVRAMQIETETNLTRRMILNCLSPETMAVITVRSCLAAPNHPVASLSVEIGARCKQQRELELFRDSQRERVKAAKARGEHAVDLFKLMKDRAKNVDARTFRRWKKRVGEFDRLDWKIAVRAWLGLNLIGLLVTHGSGWFEMELVRKHKGRRFVTERQLQLTAAATAWIEQRHREFELQRPWLVPTLCPPADWVRVPNNSENDDVQT